MRELTNLEQTTIDGGRFNFFSNLNAGLLGHICVIGDAAWSFAEGFVDGFTDGAEMVIEPHLSTK